MQSLDNLITAAMQLAGTDDKISHNARLWQMEGGRACPIEWGGCSQPVYVDLKTGEHDYGDPGGPGHAYCVRNCSHEMNPPPPCDDWDDVPNVELSGLRGSLRSSARTQG